jgi:hypothetical protein
MHLAENAGKVWVMAYYQISPSGQLIKCTDDGGASQCVVLSESDVPSKLKTMVAERTGGVRRFVAFAIRVFGGSQQGQWIISDEAAGEPRYSDISESEVPQQIKDAFEKLGTRG